MWWYHLIGLIWISEFILACQHMTIAGSVVTYYFTRFVFLEETLGNSSFKQPIKIAFHNSFQTYQNSFLKHFLPQRQVRSRDTHSLINISFDSKPSWILCPRIIHHYSGKDTEMHTDVYSPSDSRFGETVIFYFLFYPCRIHFWSFFVILLNVLFNLQENLIAKFLLKCCICCLWILEKCLKYLNYVSTLCFSVLAFGVKFDALINNCAFILRTPIPW